MAPTLVHLNIVNPFPHALTDFTNKSNVVVQLSGNDFFSHITTTDPYTNLRHFTKLNIMKGSNDRKAFFKIIDSFFKNFEGQLVVVVGMFPRYININCCSDHRATQTEQKEIHNLVKLVNIGLSKMCNFHTKTGTAKFIFLHPESILQSAGLTQENSLHCDNVHLSDKANKILADAITATLSSHFHDSLSFFSASSPATPDVQPLPGHAGIVNGGQQICGHIVSIQMLADLRNFGVLGHAGNNRLHEALDVFLNNLQMNQVTYPSHLLAEIYRLTNLFPHGQEHSAGDIIRFLLQHLNVLTGSLVETATQSDCLRCGRTVDSEFSPIVSLMIPDVHSINISQLVYDHLYNLERKSETCVECGVPEDTVVITTGGGFVVVELHRTSHSFGQTVSHARVTFDPVPNSPIGDPLFIISRKPGHWIAYAKHQVNQTWFRLDDSNQPVECDPMAEQSQSNDFSVVLFRAT